MTELEWEGRPERPSLRRAIRHRLRHLDPSIRVVAEGFMAETSAIDLLAVGGEGEIISIRIGRGGDDLSLFTQVLADLTWLRPRLVDFLKLAPGLGLEPSAAPRAMLVCPDFERETEAAAQACVPRSIELASYRCLRQQGQLSVLLETRPPTRQPLAAGPTTHDDRRPARPGADLISPKTSASFPSATPSTTERTAARSARVEARPGFRTGLRDTDLRVEVEEEKILD